MKKIGAMIVLLVFLAIACTDVPVKKVKKCARIVDVKLYQSYFLRIIPDTDVDVYKVLDNGDKVKIYYYNYYNDANRGKVPWIEVAKKKEIGRDYCWTEYERIK